MKPAHAAPAQHFQAYTEIIDEKFRYPNSALVGLRFDSRQFGSIPSRKYLIRGIKVKIPSNATVDTHSSGTDYIFRRLGRNVSAATWTNDPAWCLYDLLINDRYGAGVPEDTLDRYMTFLQLAVIAMSLLMTAKAVKRHVLASTCSSILVMRFTT